MIDSDKINLRISQMGAIGAFEHAKSLACELSPKDRTNIMAVYIPYNELVLQDCKEQPFTAMKASCAINQIYESSTLRDSKIKFNQLF
ncbi:hypothetical protein [Providencia sp. PROV132]|uniref:hypothetical protein n=1 Tax=Providencia sp. PROV132 TaxID=2949842 RepID=UPI00234ADBA8|nr:hypothetical protein [Providencia sp. PROV132]